VNGASTIATFVEANVNGVATQIPIYVNHGLVLGGRTIHQGAKIGYSPLVVLETEGGEQLLNGFTRLATHTMNGGEIYKDFIEIPEKHLRVECEFLPEGVLDSHSPPARSGTGKAPVLHLVMRQRDVVILDEFIPRGRTISISGYRAHFADVRRWSQLDVADDPGPMVLIVGSLLAALGLALRLLVTRRRVVVSLRRVNNAVMFDLDGSTEKFQQAFEEELASLRAAIAVVFASAKGGDPRIEPVPSLEEVV